MSGAQDDDTIESSSAKSSSTHLSRLSYGGEESADLAAELLEPFGIISREMEQQLSVLNELASAVPAGSHSVASTVALNRPGRSETRRSIIRVSEGSKELPSSTMKESKFHLKKKKSDTEVKKKRWSSVLGPALGSVSLVVFVLVGLVAVFAFAIVFRGGRVAPLAHSANAATRNDTASLSG
ncbi:uncharacterized protein LOC144103514 [Amblyomma americanum]